VKNQLNFNQANKIMFSTANNSFYAVKIKLKGTQHHVDI